jgi:hypothetical protein
MINLRQPSLLFVLLLTTVSATAQITGSGTSGYVPVFTGTSTIGNSSTPIFVYNSNVGFGTTTPGSPIEVYGITTSTSMSLGTKSSMYASPSATSSAFYTGVFAQGVNNGSQTMNGSYGSGGLVGTISKALNQGTGTVVNAYGIVADVQNISTGVITNSYTMYVPNPYVTHGSITNAYGLYINNITSGTSSNYSLYVAGANSYFGSNVGIGTTTPGAKLEINGGLRFTADPTGTVQTTAWTGVLCGGDYAEAVNARGDSKAYEPGDVIVLSQGRDGEVEKSSEAYSTMVAGIYATKPGVIGRRQTLPKGTDELPMAMIGIVPTKVSAENGPIRKGDLLVTSSKAGYAMRGTDRDRMLGAVIGKSMGSLDSGAGIIEVLVTLQ